MAGAAHRMDLKTWRKLNAHQRDWQFLRFPRPVRVVLLTPQADTRFIALSSLMV